MMKKQVHQNCGGGTRLALPDWQLSRSVLWGVLAALLLVPMAQLAMASGPYQGWSALVRVALVIAMLLAAVGLGSFSRDDLRAYRRRQSMSQRTKQLDNRA